MNHSFYLILTRFISASGFKIARSSVREALIETDGIFDLSKFPDLLNSFFSDLLVIQVDSQMDNHDSIITPCILLKTEKNQTYMYVVLKIDKKEVFIYDCHKKDHTISEDEFCNILKESVIILKENETYDPREELLKAYYKEQDEDEGYIKNIKVIDDFISTIDCEKIIEYCERNDLFQRSKISVKGYGKKSDYRTSSSAILENNQTIPILSDLKTKTARLLECNVDNIEKLQCVRYYKNEIYKPHFDSLFKKRRFTCLLYLNEGFLGGETYFPEVDFGVAPKTGRLLIFQNLDEDDNVIIQSYHQGSKILEGQKYACNIWIEN